MIVTEGSMDGQYNGFGRYGQSDAPRYGGFGQVYGDDGRARQNDDGRARDAGTDACRDAGDTYDEARMREDIARYGAMSGDDLTDELFRKARQMKSEGRLDTALLEDFAAKAAPFLAADELKRLRELISMLKNV